MAPNVAKNHLQNDEVQHDIIHGDHVQNDLIDANDLDASLNELVNDQ